jgi:alkanesulfonate monooxygenase SsuD/methylene tetrahydromethanopterin reductase-like flavin-dependent oxidoreductase (luciferase family)
VTCRHPAVLAKIAAAAGHVSHGRLTLGAGAGWQENEHAAYGITLGTARERMDWCEEAVQILRSLPGQPRTTFRGRYFQLCRRHPSQPAPVQDRLPLLAGGGEQRTLRIAARYADHRNSRTTPEVLAHKVSVLQGHCHQAGRDPGEIHVSTQAPLYLSAGKEWLREKRQARPGQPVIAGTPGEVTAIVARYQDAGADEPIIQDVTLGSMARKKDTCDLFMQQVAPAFR